MTDTKWLSEEQALLEEARTFDLRDVSLLLDRLAAEREKNANLTLEIEQGFMKGAYARLKELQTAERELTAERERNRELVEALHKLMKEAAGFWALANVDDHGYTNLAVLKLRIDEAASALAKNAGKP